MNKKNSNTRPGPRKGAKRQGEFGTHNPDPIDKHVGQRIRARRKIVNLTQTELGAFIGVTFQQVQKYERGTNRIGASRLLRIAERLQAPVAYFFEGSEHLLPGHEFDNKTFEERLESDETKDLLRLYYMIEHKTTRAQVMDFVRMIALK